MAEPTTPEDAVRRYLAWIDDPASVVDQEAVTQAEDAFAKASDPLDRLHAAAALERARTADGVALTFRFVENAWTYASAEGIPVEAFRALGVPDDVLSQAGFEVPRGRGRGPAAPAKRSTRRSSGAPRAANVQVGQLKSVAVQMPKRFTLAQLAEKAGGGSPATVRKAVEELVANGRVANMGPDPDHHGPGRAPTLYELR